MLSVIPGLLVPLALVAVPVTPTRHTAVAQSRTVLQRITRSNWRHLPYSGGVLYATAVRNGWIRPQMSPHVPHLIPDLACSRPYPCVFQNVDASEGGTVNETPIAANPINHRQLISGGNDWSCSTLGGFFVSSNAGRTWKRSCIQFSGSGEGDPIVGFDLNGVAWRGGIDGGTAIAVSSSTDGGISWSSPVAASTSYFGGGLADKPWLQIDVDPASPRKGTMYNSVTQFDRSNDTEITVSHSTDGGKTWTMVPLGQYESYPVVNQFTDLATAPDGTVYVTWMRCTAAFSTDTCGGTTATMLISKSTDGGNTWSPASTVASVNLAPSSPCGAFYGCVPNTYERLSNAPATAVDHTSHAAKGTIYMAFYNYTGSFCQVLVTKSVDGGSTWSTPVAVAPPSETHDQFFQWLSANPKTGWVGVTWMDRRNDPSNFTYEEFGGVSKDGGNTFTNIQLAANPSNPNNDGFYGQFMGDYSGNYWDGQSLYASWTDTSLGHAQDFVGGQHV